MCIVNGYITPETQFKCASGLGYYSNPIIDDKQSCSGPNSDHSKSGLTTTNVIIIASVGTVAIISIAAIVVVVRRRKAKKAHQNSIQDDETDPLLPRAV